MKHTFGVLVLCSVFCSNAQQPDNIKLIDSLILESRFSDASEAINTLLRDNPGPNRSLLLNKRAQVQLGDGKLNDAKKTLDEIQAINSTDPQSNAVYLTNKGSYNMNRGRFDLAQEDLAGAYRQFQELSHPSVPDIARCVGLMSLNYFATGKYKLAEDNALVTLQLRRSYHGERHEAVAAAYNDLGLVYTPTDPDKALEYYEKALETYRRLHGNSHIKIAIASANIGILYRGEELYGDAINNLEAALKIWKANFPEGHPNQAFVLRNLGQTYFAMENYATALAYFQQALDLYRRFYGDRHPEIASTLNQIGVVKLEQAQYEPALNDFQAAICANIATFNNKDVMVNPPIDGYYNGLVLLYSLRLKAQGFEELHFGKTLNKGHLEMALSTLFLCDSLIDDIRHHSSDETDKISLGGLASDVYEDGVRVSTALSEIALKPRPFLEKAFYFAEKSKSAVLQESIADTQAKSFAGIPQEFVEEETTLKANIALLSQRLGQKPPASEEAYIRESLIALKHEYASFIQRLEKEYPDYFNLKFNVASPAISDIQQLLNEGEAIISYFITARSGRIHQFVITNSSFRAYHNTLPENFERATRGFNNGIFYRDFQTYLKSTKILSTLRPRTKRGTRELIIVPAGRLGTMPFEALAMNPKKARDFQSVEYLNNRFAVSYEFSAGLIVQKNKTQAVRQPRIFLCAPVSFPAKEGLAELPGSEAEVRDISELFADDAMRIFLKSDANEAVVKSKDLATYSYLHFATHGIVDEEEPDKSRIFLNDNAAEDGALYASEIYNLSLNADLAVLSACQTGLGKYSEGEGVIGLSRALVYAGARSLVVSFWSVADQSTAILMKEFYSNQLGRNAASHRLAKNAVNFRTSLQQAKEKMIKDARFSEPYFWAPFVLIGF
jgi:CHAT domain-containing protein/tetratricopeptide (TPR) repeat protein